MLLYYLNWKKNNKTYYITMNILPSYVILTLTYNKVSVNQNKTFHTCGRLQQQVVIMTQYFFDFFQKSTNSYLNPFHFLRHISFHLRSLFTRGHGVAFSQLKEHSRFFLLAQIKIYRCRRVHVARFTGTATFLTNSKFIALPTRKHLVYPVCYYIVARRLGH